MDESGFKKIDVTDDTGAKETIEGSAVEKKKKRFLKTKRFKIFGIAGIIIIVLVALFALIGFRVVSVVANAKSTQSQAKMAFDAIKQQNITLTKDELVKTKEKVEKLSKSLDALRFVKFIPLLGVYQKDAQHLVAAASLGVDAAIIATDALIPYADVLGLQGESSFVGGSAQDRIRQAVNTMSKVVPEIDRIEEKLILAKKEVDQVDPSRYPNISKLKGIKEQIASIKEAVDGGVLAVSQGKPLIKALPSLLGESEGKKYLVLFQNDAELRPTGGFLTYYAFFRVEEGIIEVDASSDIYNLDDSISVHPPPDEIIEKYLPKVDKQYIRDINLSPDFIVSMDDFLELYEKSSISQDFDGIIAIDTEVLVNAIAILGEVNAAGLTFNSEIDDRCDCPQVVYVLENEISRPVGFVKDNRKSLISSLLFATMEKALASSPGQYWGPLFQQFIKDAGEKHVLFYIFDEDAQSGLDALNWSGRIREFDGDYLHINDANFGGAKSNLYVKGKVKMEYEISSENEITRKITIEYRNPREHSDCSLERGGLCLNATLRNFQRVYVPEGSVLINSKGSEVKVEVKKGLGKTFFESFFTVNPLGKAEISYEYKLPFKLNDDSILPVLIQKQPGVKSIAFEIFVNGEKVDEFDLVKDRELELEVF